MKRLGAFVGILLGVAALAPAHAGYSYKDRLIGTIDGFDAKTVQIRLRRGILVTVSRDAFSPNATIKPGEHVDMQVRARHLLRVRGLASQGRPKS